MTNVGVALFPIIILFAAILSIGLEVLIGVYVYRDAVKRNMNAVLWTLVSVFAPYLVGFIIYLFVRENHPNMSCPECNTKITDQYVVCPNCGAQLKASCPNCKTPVEAGWKVCPTCANPLPEEYEVKKPKKAKDHLWKILIAIIVIPITVLLIGFLVLVGVKRSGSSSDEVQQEYESVDYEYEKIYK